MFKPDVLLIHVLYHRAVWKSLSLSSLFIIIFLAV